MRNRNGISIALALAGALDAATLSTEAELKAALLRGTGAYELTADVKLTADLPALPAGSRFTLAGKNHALSGGGKYSMFKCPNDSTVLTLENLTLRNGFTHEHGAAVSSGQGVAVARDIPGFGPVPIMIEGSRSNRVIIRNCILKDNVSAKSGGAVFVHLEGEPGEPYLLIENSALIGNSVMEGPAIPTFKVNAEYNNGGAIWERVQAYRSDVQIRNTTFSGNYAPELGGAILIGESAGPPGQAMAVKLLHCTVVGNDCGMGGGAFWNDHSLLVDHSVVSGNTLGKNPAANGADFAGPGPSLTIRWSDIGNRADENGLPIEQRCQSPVKGFSSILESNTLTVDPMLSPLPLYLAAGSASGTAYATYAYVFDPASPLYNSGDPGLSAGLGTTPAWDQRGEPKNRIENGRIDIGAFEYAPGPLPESIPPAPGPAWLQAQITGVVSAALPEHPPRLENPILIGDGSPGGGCLNCAGPREQDAFQRISSGAGKTRFPAHLMAVKTNRPARYRVKFFTTLGQFVNEASGSWDAETLKRARMDEDGNATLNLYWWPVSREGEQAATGAYILRGSLWGEPRPATRGLPAPVDSLSRTDVSRIFGYLRR